MYIDFHTHIFPERIAAATLAQLGTAVGITPYTDGTVDGLLRSMNEAGIDRSVILPVVTKPSQFDSINRFAQEINRTQTRLISFAGIHPDNNDIEAKLDEIVENGFRGIKLHPDYQGVFIDDERYLRILQGAVDRSLYVTIHAGIDKGLPDPVHCPPARTRKALDALSLPEKPYIILAHGGGWGCWDEVETHLCGQAVYLDLAVTMPYCDPAQLTRIIRAHGAHHILFASDSPWGSQSECVKAFEALPLRDDERQLIAHENARHILGC